MIAVDVNIVVHLFIEGSHSTESQSLFKKDSHWILPDIWIHEMTNVLSTYVKHGGMSLENGIKILNDALNYFADSTFSLSMAEVLSLSVNYNISGYDAAYIVLAKYNKIPLLTLDKKLSGLVPEYTRLLT